MRSCWSLAVVAVAAVCAGCSDLKPDEPGSMSDAAIAGRNAGGSSGSAGSAGSTGSVGSAGEGAGAGGDGAAGSESGAGTGGAGGEGAMNCEVQRYYRDQDGDGFGTEADAKDGCEPPDGYVAPAGDCDDGCATCHGEGTETCDGFDNNCDGQTDENTDEKCGSLEGVCEEGVKRCVSGVLSACEGGVEAGTEACEGQLDENCDGTIDEGCTCSGSGSTACGETRGECSAGQQACVNGVLGDCTGGVGPTGETCDNKDNDCDGATDEGIATRICGLSTGSCEQGVESCVSGGWVCTGGVNAVAEVCDGDDNDCDNKTDEGLGSTWYRDADSDGYGTATTSMRACTKPSGYVADATDCNDQAGAVNPGGSDANCDGNDNDCDDKFDEAGGPLWYRDADTDGYGLASNSRRACSRPTGYVDNSTDCDDTTSANSPAAAERCDTKDNDCDGSNNEGNVCCGDGVKQSGEACDTGINGWNCSDSCTAISGRSPTAYQKCFEDASPSICNTAAPWNEVCGSPGGSGQHLQCLPWDFGEGCRTDARYTIGRGSNSPQCWLTCTTDASCPDHMKCISSGAGSENAPGLICVPR